MDKIEKRFIDSYAQAQYEMYGIKHSATKAALRTLKKLDPKEYQKKLNEFFDTIHPY